MIVCLCKNLTDKQILKVIQNGADSTEKVMKVCGVGTDCGTCIVSIEQLVRRSTDKSLKK